MKTQPSKSYTFAIAWGKRSDECFSFYKGFTTRIVIFWYIGLYFIPLEIEEVLEKAFPKND
jgi:hypothetical protein